MEGFKYFLSLESIINEVSQYALNPVLPVLMSLCKDSSLVGTDHMRDK